MDPSKEILTDQISIVVASGGQSVGPLHVPRGGRGILQKIKAGKSVLAQLLSKSKNEASLAEQITKHRAKVMQTQGGNSPRTVRG